MRKKLLILFGALCLVAVFGTTVQAATLRVGANEQFKTVQEAIIAANDFDTIHIEPGVYRSDKVILINGRKGLSIEGAGPDKVQLIATDLREDVIMVKDCNDIRIANVNARHDPQANVTCAGYVISVLTSANTTINDCELNGCGSVGVGAIKAQNINIIHNNIHHNSFAGLYLFSSTGLVQDNVIVDNKKAVEIGDKSNNIVFKNNTFERASDHNSLATKKQWFYTEGLWQETQDGVTYIGGDSKRDSVAWFDRVLNDNVDISFQFTNISGSSPDLGGMLFIIYGSGATTGDFWKDGAVISYGIGDRNSWVRLNGIYKDVTFLSVKNSLPYFAPDKKHKVKIHYYNNYLSFYIDDMPIHENVYIKQPLKGKYFGVCNWGKMTETMILSDLQIN